MIRKDINKKDWEISISVPAEKEKWKQKQNEVLKDLAKKFNMTVEDAKKELHLSNVDVQIEAAGSILSDLHKIAVEEIDENLIILDSSICDVEKISDSELELKFTWPIYPEFTLKNYTGLNIPFEQRPVTEKEIMAEIEKIAEKNASLIDKEENNEKIEKGDVVNINNVFSKEKLKLDDSIVHLVKESKAKTLDELKNYFKNLLTEERLEKAEDSFIKNVFEKIKESNKIPIPKLALMKETEKAMKEFEDNVSKRGYSVNEHLKMLNMDREEVITKLNEESEVKISEEFIFLQISKQEKIEASEEECEKEYERAAKLFNISVESVKVSKEQMRNAIINRKVLDFLIEKNSAKE